ncbi:DUF3558 domain-containing protein [Amycolatopsis sp. NPDC059027]|uniref:DUF3558 domain-containing protein n=1 Tax=Amycolatopsis sp. NPDC059027 TaxID=3346709 RepID=UPI00366BD5A7
MTSSRTRIVLITATLVLAGAAGCSSEVPGQPSTAPSAPRTGPSQAGTSNSRVPQVAQPLNADKYVANPCASLTSAQLKEFESNRDGTRQDFNGDPNCHWQVGPNNDTGVGVTYARSNTDGIGRLYALNDTGWWRDGYFEPTSVQEYPAVFTDIIDKRRRGDCGLAVAVSNSLYFDVSIQSSAGDKSCVAAKNVATAVLDTIKKGA